MIINLTYVWWWLPAFRLCICRKRRASKKQEQAKSRASKKHLEKSPSECTLCNSYNSDVTSKFKYTSKQDHTLIELSLVKVQTYSDLQLPQLTLALWGKQCSNKTVPQWGYRTTVIASSSSPLLPKKGFNWILSPKAQTVLLEHQARLLSSTNVIQ